MAPTIGPRQIYFIRLLHRRRTRCRDRRGGGIMPALCRGPAVARRLAAHDTRSRTTRSDLSGGRDLGGVWRNWRHSGSRRCSAVRGGILSPVVLRPSTTSSAATGWSPRCADHYSEQLIRLPNLSIYYEPADPPLTGLIGRSSGCVRTPSSIGAASRCRNVCRNLTRCSRALRRRFRDVNLHLSNSQVAGHHRAVQARLDRAFKAVGLAAGDHCVFCRDWRPIVLSRPSVNAMSYSTASAGQAATRSWRALPGTFRS